MRPGEWILRTGFRSAARIFYRNADQADWIYEKVHRPGNVFVLGMNVLHYLTRRPKIHGFVSVVLEPMSACNLRCVYCWGELEDRLKDARPRQMDWPLFQQIVDQSPPSVESITIGGQGEPLMHPRLGDMVDYVVEKGKRAILYTNGTLLSGDRLERLAQTPLSVLNLSIEPDAATCREYRGVDLEELKQNIAAYRERKQPMTEVKLSMVAHPGNLDRLAGVYEIWDGLIDGVKISPQFGLREKSERVSCMEPWRGNLYITTSGKVTTCCFDCFEELAVGDLHQQTLTEVIEGDALQDFLRRMLSDSPPERCCSCSQFNAPRIPIRAPRRVLKQDGGGS